MRRKTEGPSAPKVIETFRIQTKFAPEVLVPSNAIDNTYWGRPYRSFVEMRFETLDGVIVRPEFTATWNLKEDSREDFMDEFCMSKWSIPFCNLSSVWTSRLGKLDNYWHYIKLTRIG